MSSIGITVTKDQIDAKIKERYGWKRFFLFGGRRYAAKQNAMLGCIVDDAPDEILGLVYFVDEENGSDANSGLSLGEAFATRQRAINETSGRRADIVIKMGKDDDNAVQ
jgi:hypothetical protein